MWLAQLEFPIIEDLQEFGQTPFNIAGMLVMTMFTFALVGLVFMLFKLRTAGQPRSGDLTPALQTLGGVIANEMRSVVEDAKEDRAMFMESFAANSREHTGIIKALENLALGLTGHNSKVDANQTAITQLSAEQKKSNEQVLTMNGDILRLEAKIDNLGKNVLLLLEKLEQETSAETEKLPGLPLTPPATVAPTQTTHTTGHQPGVPVTPQPDKQSANLYKDNPKEENK